MAFKGQRTSTEPTTDELNETFPPESDNEDTASSEDWLDNDDAGTAEEETDYQQLNPPAGDWVKSDRFEVKVVRIEGDSLPGDRNPLGRVVFNVSGKPDVRVVSGQDYQPFLMFRVSPDKRTWENDNGETGLDSAYKLWLEAKNNVFISIYGRKHKSLQEVVRMLELDDYTISSYRGSNGPTVNHIKPLRKKR